MWGFGFKFCDLEIKMQLLSVQGWRHRGYIMVERNINEATQNSIGATPSIIKSLQQAGKP
jgi:hypothetical protein